jgi:subtilisin family serine protease
VDDDGNGFVDDVNGWDFAENDNTLVEANSQIIDFDHGTHTAGTAAAQMNNGAGIAGVCPGCRLMILKFFKPEDFDGDGFREQMAGNLGAELAAIDYAIEMGADIINASFGGGPFWSRLERNAFAAAGQAGILTVAAAGNANGDNDLFMALDFDGDGIPDSESPDFPSAYNLSTILAVAATNHHDEYGYLTGCAGILGTRSAPCAFTNWGHESVDVAAPGVDVLSTVPGGYAFFSGTSMSAPLVSGIAGLISSLHPNDSPLALKNRIMNSVDHPANLETLHAFPGPPAQGAFTKTNGRVNAAQALNASTAGGAPTTNGNIPGAKGLKTVRAGIRWTSAGKVAWPEDVNDVYRQSLKAGTYRVTLDGPAGDDFDLFVWDRGTLEIWQLQDGCFGGPGRCPILGAGVSLDADEQVRVRLRRNGVRFFHVAAFPPSEGRYKLTVLKLS